MGIFRGSGNSRWHLRWPWSPEKSLRYLTCTHEVSAAVATDSWTISPTHAPHPCNHCVSVACFANIVYSHSCTLAGSTYWSMFTHRTILDVSCIINPIIPPLKNPPISRCQAMLPTWPPWSHGCRLASAAWTGCRSSNSQVDLGAIGRIASVNEFAMENGNVYIWLVVTGTFFPYIGNVIIPIDFHMFQRGWNHQPDIFL